MQNKSEERQVRPEFLKLLCILSFIGGGLSVVTNFFMFLYFDEWVLAYTEGQFDEFIGSLDMEAISVFLDVGSQFFLIQALLYGLSVFGVYFMWNLRKPGFHMYTIAQILVLIVQQLYLPSLPFPLIPFLLTSTFVLLYFKNFSYMH